MKILLNSTKTMDGAAVPPPGLQMSTPQFQTEAADLMPRLQRLSRPRLAAAMSLSPGLTDETRALLAAWDEQAPAPALLAFTGLVYKYVAAAEWTPRQWRDAQSRLWILSGLYGLLRPLDAIAPYRLEMGSGFKPPLSRNLAVFWRERLTDALGQEMAPGEPILNLAAQEYTKALACERLPGPVLSPVFKETRPDGTLKNVAVHAKMARGAMVHFVFTTGARQPEDLLAFQALGWEPSCEPPTGGNWLFTRPTRE